MKKRRLFLLVMVVVMLGTAQALAAEVKVIANSSVRADSISAAELKSVYLEQTRSLEDGSHVEPVLATRGSAHERFLKQYLGQSDDDLQTYYRSLVFTGKGSMPKALNSDADVVAYVSRTRGAIGYVGAESSVEGVKTLLVTSGAGNSVRRLIRHVDPEYPETLRRLHIGGTVRLELTISAKGSVDDAAILGGNPILVESAILAVKQWVYAPSHSRTSAAVSIPFDPEH